MNPIIKFVNKGKRLLRLDSYVQKEMQHLEFMVKHDAMVKEALHSTQLGITDKRYCDHEIVVSMTTYGKRLYSVAPVIESIMQGSVKPNHFVLNLGEDLNEISLPVGIQNQQKRGLEVNYVKDTRSYKKLIPTLRKYPNAAIITIDDDLIYHYDLIEKLISTHLENPEFIIANRVHRIKLGKDGRPVGYLDWEPCANPDDVSFLNFFTGGGGTLYPPRALPKEVLNEDVFMDICPYADDVWFNSMALLNGTKTKKCYTHNDSGADYVLNDEVQDTGLCNINTSKKRGQRCKNDDQLEAVFNKYNLWGKLYEGTFGGKN